MSQWEPFRDPVLPVSLFLAMYRTDQSLVKSLEERLKPFDLTLGRLCLLVSLRKFDQAVLPSELSDDLAVTRANVSGLLNGLEKLGLVRRDLDPTNRRRILVRLTEQGGRMLDDVWPIYVEAIVSRVEGKLTDAEQKQLLTLLKKLDS